MNTATDINQDTLLSVLREDLTTLRPFGAQVIAAISHQFGFTEDRLPEFFSQKLPLLEVHELDLTFSPLFTPRLEEREKYAALLGNNVLETGLLSKLSTGLADQNLSAPLETSQGEIYQLPLFPVIIERYVGRLHLEKPLPEKVFKAICAHVPPAFQNRVNMLGRESAWRKEERQDLLIGFLAAFARQNSFTPEKVQALTDFVRTYRPADREDLARKLESLIASCKKDLETLPNRGFHDDHLKTSYADSEMSHAAEERQRVQAFYQTTIQHAQALLSDLENL